MVIGLLIEVVLLLPLVFPPQIISQCFWVFRILHDKDTLLASGFHTLFMQRKVSWTRFYRFGDLVCMTAHLPLLFLLLPWLVPVTFITLLLGLGSRRSMEYFSSLLMGITNVESSAKRWYVFKNVFCFISEMASCCPSFRLKKWQLNPFLKSLFALLGLMSGIGRICLSLLMRILTP